MATFAPLPANPPADVVRSTRLPHAAEIVRCDGCRLTQFMTKSGQCRKCGVSLLKADPVPEPEPKAVPARVDHHETDLCKLVAQRICNLRRARGLSQRQLATAMAVPRTYISKLENAKAMPTVQSLTRLAEALRVPIALLLADCDDDGVTLIAANAFVAELAALVKQFNADQQHAVLLHAKGMARFRAAGKDAA